MGQGFAKVRLTSSISKTHRRNFKKNEKFVSLRAFLQVDESENFIVNTSHKTSFEAKIRGFLGN
jgi:hypothetical protein